MRLRMECLLSGRRKQACLLDLARIAGEWTLAKAIELDLGDERLRIFAPRLSEIGVQFDEARQDRSRKTSGENGVSLSRDLEQEAGAHVAVRTLRQREAERIRHLGERGVVVQALLDIFRIDVGAHDADRVIAPAEDPQERKAHVPVTVIATELLDVDADRSEPLSHLVIGENAP